MKSKILVLAAAFLLIGVNLYAAGDLQVNGTLGIGTAPNAEFKVDIATTDVRGLRNISTVTDVATTVMEAAGFAVKIEGIADYGMYYGFVNRVEHAGENPNLLKIIGGDNTIQFNSTYAGTTNVIFAEALRATVSSSNAVARNYDLTGAPDGVIGIAVKYSFPDTTGGGTIAITDMKGINIDAPSGTPLSVSNATGIWVNQQAVGSTNNYGIVLDGDGAGADIVFGTSQEARIYSSAGELYVQDGASNVTQISPHDPETGEWVFFSKNIKTGRVVRINMEKMVKAVEKLTGESFMIETLVEDK